MSFIEKENFGFKGHVYEKVEYKDGRVEYFDYPNKIVKTARANYVKSLANQFGDSYEYFISGIAFGDGGNVGGSRRVVDDDQTGLFGTTIITKPVIASIDPSDPATVIFTAVLRYEDANGFTINEMMLKTFNGDAFSIATRGNYEKTDESQRTLNWVISFVG